MRVTNRFFGMRDFPYLKLGIRDLKAKSGRDSGLKVYVRDGMPKITLRITGLHEILGRDYGIEEPHLGPSNMVCYVHAVRAMLWYARSCYVVLQPSKNT